MVEAKGKQEDATMAIMKSLRKNNNFECQRYFKFM